MQPLYIQKLTLPGFTYPTPPYGGLAFASFSPDSSETQFEAFAGQVHRSLGRSYLPIYRMADGEFAFLIGWHPPLKGDRTTRSTQGLRQFLGGLRRRIDPRVSTTMWGESYSRTEQVVAHSRMEQSIRHIAEQGILALYLMNRADRWGEQYINPIIDWHASRQISLNTSNYVPFYFVYALLNGPARKQCYQDRHILVVTHLTDSRGAAMEDGLRREGVASVQFLNISADRSMLDQIDLSSVRRPVDLALVAAGIGSANILEQLEPLSVPCIDSGICLECFIDFNRRFERPFLLDDQRMEAQRFEPDLLRFLRKPHDQR